MPCAVNSRLRFRMLQAAKHTALAEQCSRLRHIRRGQGFEGAVQAAAHPHLLSSHKLGVLFLLAAGWVLGTGGCQLPAKTCAFLEQIALGRPIIHISCLYWGLAGGRGVSFTERES